MASDSTLSQDRKKMANDLVRDVNGFEFEGVWFPYVTTPDILRQLKDFEIREDDVILATPLKGGTNWINEVVQLILVDGHVEKIVRDVQHKSMIEVVLPLDHSRGTYEVIATKKSPRVYSTHLPVKLLPSQVWTKKPKIVYVTRDPKDTCTSLYRFLNANPMNKEPIPWEFVFDKFISEKAFWGNWFDHALGYWEHRNEENVIFLTYEEMKKDLRSVVRRLERFLGVSVTPEGMERVLENSSIEEMKKTYAKIEEDYENGKMYTRAYGLMPFIQTGTSGSWKSQFTDEQRDKMDRLLKERLTGTGLEAHYH